MHTRTHTLQGASRAAILQARLGHKGPDRAGRTYSWRGNGILRLMPTLKPAALLHEMLTDEQTFVLRFVQPGLAGLMDGSVSTLAPIFATAFATHRPHTAYLIGVAAAVGAGISMAFAEGLSDDGAVTGRGAPLARGLITGGMTFVGGFLHTVPFLISNMRLALDVAYGVVGCELLVISWIRYRFMKTSFAASCLQVLLGGGLVFLAGVLIGQS